MKEKLNTETKQKIMFQVIESVPKQNLIRSFAIGLKELAQPKQTFELKEFEKLEAKPVRHKEIHNQRWV